jgi:GcrA cell cycle regulator
MSGHYPNAFNWTDEAIERAKALASNGATGSEIANDISLAHGVRVSRNAVIGKLHRLGLNLKGQQAPNSAGTARRRPRAEVAEQIRSLDEEGIPRRQIVSLAGVRYREVSKVLGPVSDEDMEAKRARPHLRDLPRSKVTAWMDRKVEKATGATAESRLLTIMDLKESSCRWPIGEAADPSFRYCGADKVEGYSYCAAHCKAAYQPPAASKKVTTWLDGPKRRNPDQSGAGRVFA